MPSNGKGKLRDMNETSKAVMRRIHDNRFATRYLVGHGIDIGCGDDSIGQYKEFFPLMESVMPWDLKDGDAQYMGSLPEKQFDFVHSSHCLEHLKDPLVALSRWCSLLKPEGHLVVLIPEEDMYEQGYWPSRFNGDHKHTFTILKQKSWSPVSINLLDLLPLVPSYMQVVRLEVLDATYFRSPKLKGVDQTQCITGECAIEFIMRRVG